MKKRAPLESWEQEQVIKYCEIKKLPAFAIPNGTYIKTPASRAKAKREGLKAGVPDLFLPVAASGFHGLFIEMKRANGAKSDVSKAQREWIALLNRNGYYAAVAFGHADAIEGIEKYIAGELNGNG